MPIQQVLGLGFIVLGLVCVSSYIDDLAWLRMSWFYRELKPMQERWGRNAGTVLHFVEYVLTPVGFGILFLTGMVAFS